MGNQKTGFRNLLDKEGKIMPYIPEYRIRIELDAISTELIRVLKREEITGNLNYFIFRTIKHLCKKYANYAHFEGDLLQALHEAYRRFEAPYEDKKIEENGDVA